MEKGCCCNVQITELEDGYRFEVKGEGLKERFDACLKGCCGENMGKKGIQICCGTGR